MISSLASTTSLRVFAPSSSTVLSVAAGGSISGNSSVMAPSPASAPETRVATPLPVVQNGRPGEDPALDAST